jgi:hypothetical protein
MIFNEQGYKEILTMVRIEGCAVGHIFDRRHPKTLLPKLSKSRSSGFRGDANIQLMKAFDRMFTYRLVYRDVSTFCMYFLDE